MSTNKISVGQIQWILFWCAIVDHNLIPVWIGSIILL